MQDDSFHRELVILQDHLARIVNDIAHLEKAMAALRPLGTLPPKGRLVRSSERAYRSDSPSDPFEDQLGLFDVDTHPAGA